MSCGKGTSISSKVVHSGHSTHHIRTEQAGYRIGTGASSSLDSVTEPFGGQQVYCPQINLFVTFTSGWSAYSEARMLPGSEESCLKWKPVSGIDNTYTQMDAENNLRVPHVIPQPPSRNHCYQRFYICAYVTPWGTLEIHDKPC